MSWEEVLARFASYQRAAGLSEKTIQGRQDLLTSLRKFSGKQPQQLDLRDLIEFLNRPHHRTQQALSQGTKQVERSYLDVWGRWMVLEGITAFNPAERLPRVRVPRRAARPIDRAHVRDLFTCGIYQPTIDKIAIGANTGLRVGEIVRLHEDHYDFRTDEIFSVRKGGFEMWVPVPPAIRDMALRKKGEGWWFPSPYPNAQFPDGGGHVLMKSASDRICNALRRIGIEDPRITAHSLRHFYCSMLIANGTPIQIVQRLMGHASIATTQLYFLSSELQMSEAIKNIPYVGPDMPQGSPAATVSKYLG